MKNLAKSLTILACCGSFFAACGGDDAAPATVPAGGTGGTGGTTAAAGGGAGGTAPTGGTGGVVAGGTGGTTGGTGGTAGSGGTGGAPPPPPPFCEDQTPKTLPFKLITGAAYVPSGWFPTADDMTAIADCTNDPITLPAFDAGVVDAGSDDAGAGDAGSADAGGGDVDAGGPPPEFTTCLGITYQKVSASAFAGINWVPNNGGANSCFEDVGAVEFWAAGTPGAHVNFEAHGTVLEVVLTEEWHKYSIAIAADLNSAGVPIAFTVGFDSTKQADPDAPFTVFYADPTYVAN